MKRCLKMLVKIKNWQSDWSLQVQEHAKKLEIEGLMQILDEQQLRIMVCGESEKIDDFMDFLYDFFITINAQIGEVEPFIKERDYRGTFRVI